MANDINQVLLVGRLGKDPEIRTMQDGTKVANFSMATGEQWKDKNTGEKREKTEWHNVVVWGGLAGVVEDYVSKGMEVLVQGKLQTRKWQDREGNDRWSTEVVLSGMGCQFKMFGGGTRDGGAGGSRPASQAPAHEDLDDSIPF